MTTQSRPLAEFGFDVLRQLRASGVLFDGHTELAAPVVSTPPDRNPAQPMSTDPKYRDARFRFALGAYSEDLELRVSQGARAAEVARAAIEAARASMLKRGFSQADLKHLRISGGEWIE
jgi:hypothetical protein